jgi:predicted ester cyclase
MILDKVAIWDSWAKLWNGDLDIANHLISPQFITHFAPMSAAQETVQGSEGLKTMIQMFLGAFEKPQFTTEIGPFADDQTITGRWLFEGVYRGGIPGSAPDAVGKSVHFYGIDIFRVENDQIVEYWLCSETLSLLQQIGVIPA